MTDVSFEITRSDRELMERVCDRAEGILAKIPNSAPVKRRDMMMDLTAVHANGNPLDFQRMLDADDFNLSHDVFGIMRHIDRTTGKLMNFFSPRFSKRDA